MFRISRTIKTVCLICLVFAGGTLPADDLLDAASQQEREGNLSGAKDLYIRWLEQEDHENSPTYGRTLLHLLRMGGGVEETLRLLDTYLPGVRNVQDRAGILRFGGYLADLAGRNRKAEEYFSRLEGQSRRNKEWINVYYGVIEGTGDPPEDPLELPLDGVDGVLAKNMVLTYLVYLQGTEIEGQALFPWLEKAERRFAFLQECPAWFFTVWHSLAGRNLEEQALPYRQALLNRYPASPEAAILRGEVQLFYNPLFIGSFSGDGEEGTAIDPASSGESVSYLQAGAFRDAVNASALRDEIAEKTGWDVKVASSGGVYRVYLATTRPAGDRETLKSLGYDVFMIPQPPRRNR